MVIGTGKASFSSHICLVRWPVAATTRRLECLVESFRSAIAPALALLDVIMLRDGVGARIFDKRARGLQLYLNGMGNFFTTTWHVVGPTACNVWTAKDSPGCDFIQVLDGGTRGWGWLSICCGRQEYKQLEIIMTVITAVAALKKFLAACQRISQTT